MAAGEPNLGDWVWIYKPGNIPRVLIDDLTRPNGVVLSADQKTLFISDTGAEQGRGDGWKAAFPRTVYAFDLVTNNGGLFAQNKRVFCVVDNGIPDGLKLDSGGNLYVASYEGIQVFNPAGKLIGKIILPSTLPDSPSVNQFVFAENKLVILHHTDVLVMTLNVTGAK